MRRWMLNSGTTHREREASLRGTCYATLAGTETVLRQHQWVDWLLHSGDQHSDQTQQPPDSPWWSVHTSCEKKIDYCQHKVLLPQSQRKHCSKRVPVELLSEIEGPSLEYHNYYQSTYSTLQIWNMHFPCVWLLPEQFHALSWLSIRSNLLHKNSGASFNQRNHLYTHIATYTGIVIAEVKTENLHFLLPFSSSCLRMLGLVCIELFSMSLQLMKVGHWECSVAWDQHLNHPACRIVRIVVTNFKLFVKPIQTYNKSSVLKSVKVFHHNLFQEFCISNDNFSLPTNVEPAHIRQSAGNTGITVGSFHPPIYGSIQSVLFIKEREDPLDWKKGEGRKRRRKGNIRGGV